MDRSIHRSILGCFVCRVDAALADWKEVIMAHLCRGVEDLNAGKGVEHEIIEVDSTLVSLCMF